MSQGADLWIGTSAVFPRTGASRTPFVPHWRLLDSRPVPAWHALGMIDNPTALLRALLDAAVSAALPERCVPPHLPPSPAGRTLVIGAGKASAAMARAVETHWPGPPDALAGLVVTRYGHAVPCRHIEIVEAAHPVPDEAGR